MAKQDIRHEFARCDNKTAKETPESTCQIERQMLSNMQPAACANIMPHVRTSASVAGSSVHGDADEFGSPLSTQSCDAFLE